MNEQQRIVIDPEILVGKTGRQRHLSLTPNVGATLAARSAPARHGSMAGLAPMAAKGAQGRMAAAMPRVFTSRDGEDSLKARCR